MDYLAEGGWGLRDEMVHNLHYENILRVIKTRKCWTKQVVRTKYKWDIYSEMWSNLPIWKASLSALKLNWETRKHTYEI